MYTLKIIYELISKGRAINWVITFLYFVSFAVILERSIYYYRTRYKFNIILNIFSHIKDIENVLKNKIFLKYKNSPIAKIIKTYIENYNKNSFNEIIEEKGFKLVQKMESNLWILSEIGHIAPLLGLLGTVTGLIRAFHTITLMGGDVDVMDLASGIWEAMLTTANGLIVAIPSFLAFRIFEKIVEKRSNDMSLVVSRLNILLKKDEKISFSKVDISKEKDSLNDEI